MKGYTSTLVPPHHLKLEDAPPATRAALPKESPSVQSLQIYPPVNPAAFSGYPGPFGYPQQPFTPYPLFYQMPTAPSTSQRTHFVETMPSSDPPEELDDVRLFPHLCQWLQDLDDGVRGDGHNFIQVIDNFEHEKYNHIVDLVDLTVADVMNFALGCHMELPASCCPMPRRTLT